MPDSVALQSLKETLGERVRTDEESLYRNSFDGMRLAFAHEADIQVDQPEQIGEVLRLANQYRVPVTTRGAGTSLTGSASPAKGGWVLRLDGLNDLEIDPLNQFAHVGPGVVVNDLQQAAKQEGLFYPPDPSSVRYCTIGGNIACNAGGMRCLKYGVTRDYVVALKGYLPTGESVSWSCDTKKFATGYNVRDLWIGSEGTLGIVTAATLKLIPVPQTTWSLLAAFPSEREALKAVESIIGRRIGPAVLEFLDRPSVRGAEAAFNQPIFDGMPGRSLLLIQLDGSEAEVTTAQQELLEWAKQEAEAFRPAPSPEEAEELWNIRRACSSAMFELGDSKLNEDVVVPIHRQAELIDEVERIRSQHQVAIAVFGHAGDGNLHVNIMHHRDDPAESKRAREALGEVMQSVVDLDGAISGEHGVGLAKSPFLSLQLGEAEIAIMRKIKDAFDPNGILNPGKLFEPYEVWNKKKEIYRFPWDHR
ncbi:FAD-binding oxidoreductase [Puniceicoccus vermicola]|uniref:FAD-binding protein n=1 Tax=Puniceicoccus vermicola TaxID=388746 RepID=A0A7X1E6J1_9BACT|nr:FAD-linked oxidase C-terminal domain-containing protein [Puniceicoccus vermicola]MBC2604158.1 FAD-binding protein [Puniceicoccus vermicola]